MMIAENHCLELQPQIPSQHRLTEGSTLSVKCSGSGNVMWSHYDTSKLTSNSAASATAIKRISNEHNAEDFTNVLPNYSTLKLEGNNTLNLVIEDIPLSANGTKFACKQTSPEECISFTIIVYKPTKVEGYYNRQNKGPIYKFKTDAILNCGVSPSNIFKYTWKKGDKNVFTLPVEKKQAYRVLKNGSLKIERPARKMAGIYTCIANLKDAPKAPKLTTNVTLWAEPFVIPFHDSINVMRGKDTRIDCKVLGYPLPRILWYKGDVLLEVVKDGHFHFLPGKTYDGRKIENTTLVLVNTNLDDAGDYFCKATHSKYKKIGSEKIIVRVRDELSVLWPIIGIIYQFVAIFSIIVISESSNRKRKLLS